jgi:cytochrome c
MCAIKRKTIMKTTTIRWVTLAAFGLLAAPLAHADEALFQKSGCAACHAVDQQRMGPTLKQIAGKYKDQADATDQLAQKVRSGGAGVWSKVPMPATPQARVSDADLKTVVAWMLTH